MTSVRLAVQALPSNVRPRCGASRYEQTEALLIGLQLLRLDAIGAKEGKQKAARGTPYSRPTPASDDGTTPGRKEKGYKPIPVQSGVYLQTFAENELGTAFLTTTGLRRHRSDAVAVTRLLLLNIPDAVPTEGAPHALQYPMLTRLRTLLEDKKLCKDVQMVISATGAEGPVRGPEDMRLIWGAFSPPASRRGYLDKVMEMVVLLYRAKEFFSPLVDDPTNALRFRTWHREVPEGWTGFDDTVHTFEYVWFHRLAAHLYVRLLRTFAGGYMIDNYATTVKLVQEVARRPVGSSEWLQ